MAFRCESKINFCFPFPVLSKYCPLPSFSQPARSSLAPRKMIKARAPCDLIDFSSSTSESSSFTIPDQSLIEKIVSQVEFYFSDDNLSKDLFLLRNIQWNKKGFVSIKLLTAFKKMKCLTQNWRVTLYALQFSKMLDINEDRTKVRRKEPIPEFFLNINLNKTLLAWNVLSCEDSCSSLLLLQENFLDTITKLFGTFGDIACIRLFRPGQSLPSAVNKSTTSYPELLTKWRALVEYERPKSAEMAFGGLSHKQFCSPGQNIRVIKLFTLKKINVVSQKDNEKIEEIPKTFKKWPNKSSESLEDWSSCSSSDSMPVSTTVVPRNSFCPQFTCTVSDPKNLGSLKRQGPLYNRSVAQNQEPFNLMPTSTTFCKPVVACPTVIRLP